MIKCTYKLISVYFVAALLCEGNLFAFNLSQSNWNYQGNPMESNWIICADGMPADASARIKDGAFAWNYSKFTFSFGTDSCDSGGIHPLANEVNQISFGDDLGTHVLAETISWFFINAPDETIECDMRFNNSITWNTTSNTPSFAQIDLQSVAAHEMGHCLGLDHEDGLPIIKPLMVSAIAPGVAMRSLTTDDTAGRDAIYGVSGTGPTMITTSTTEVPVTTTTTTTEAPVTTTTTSTTASPTTTTTLTQQQINREMIRSLAPAIADILDQFFPIDPNTGVSTPPMPFSNDK